MQSRLKICSLEWVNVNETYQLMLYSSYLLYENLFFFVSFAPGARHLWLFKFTSISHFKISQHVCRYRTVTLGNELEIISSAGIYSVRVLRCILTF